MFEAINRFFSTFGNWLLVFGIVMAILQCFFGYKLLKFWIGLIGFVIGFFGGGIVTALFVKDNAYIPIVAAILAGVLLAFIAFRIYLLGVFVLCGIVATVAVGALPVPEGRIWEVIIMILGVVAFIVAGWLAVKFSRPSIIAVTAICGAMNAIDGLREPIPFLEENHIAFWICVSVLAVAGAVVQFKTTMQSKETDRNIGYKEHESIREE